MANIMKTTERRNILKITIDETLKTGIVYRIQHNDTIPTYFYDTVTDIKKFTKQYMKRNGIKKMYTKVMYN